MTGFTRASEKLGAERTYALIQRLSQLMADAVHEHKGTIGNFTGDGIMALFGAPAAVEDAPLRACRAALDIQSRMRDREDALVAEFGLCPSLRIGIHTGQAVVGEVGADLPTDVTALGDTVNLASRIESAAESGGILMSEATYTLVEGYVEARFAGAREVKGKEAPQRTYRLDGLKSGIGRFDVAVRRGLTRLVGRQHELETLERCWEEVRGGALRIANVVGEAGIGKSRLAYEFQKSLADERAFLLPGHCTADGRNAPFLPFIEVVRTSFRLGEGMAAKEVERKLRRGLDVLGLDAEAALPYLLHLLGQPVNGALDGVAAEVVGIRTRDTILGLLRERCRMSPTLMCVEDLHWIDSASEEVLVRAMEDRDKLPLMILCTYRPQYRPPAKGPEAAKVIELGPLSGKGTIDLLKSRLDTDDLPAELTRLVLAKAEGNPLFAEEIANYLLDKGSLRRGEGGISYDTPDVSSAVSVTLENLLMDRFDRLDEGPRAALEIAAVVGQRFSPDLVRSVLGVDGALAEHLRALERQELIFRDPGRGDYRFKHALVHDAVYNSLLTGRRESLHERVAVAIETEATDGAGEHADALAHHYSNTPRAEKAVRYMALAGERSLRVYALEEAELRFRQVLDLIETVPGCADEGFLVDVLLNVARVYYFRADFKSIIALVERYLPRVEALGDKKRLSRFLFETGYAHVFAARDEEGKVLLERALALGEEIEDEEAIAYANFGLMWIQSCWGQPGSDRLQTLERIGQRVFEVGTKLGDVWLTAKAIHCLAVDSLAWGRPRESRQYCLQLIELSRETGDPRPRTLGMWALGYLNAITGEYEEGVECADESLRSALSSLDRWCAQNPKGFALAMLGRTEEGLNVLGEARRQWETGGLRMTAAANEMLYGAALVLAGDMAGGVRIIEEAEGRVPGWGRQPFTRAFGHFFLGQIYLSMALGEKTPPLSVLLRNIGFLVRTMPFVAAKARRHLEASVAECRTLNAPYFIAANLCNLGLLHKAKRRPAEARICLEEAREIALPLEVTVLIDQIDAALAELP